MHDDGGKQRVNRETAESMKEDAGEESKDEDK